MRRFEKVSLQMAKDSGISEEQYNKIVLPVRSTSGSAGYDFITPKEIRVYPSQTTWAPTGIRVFMEDDEFLSLHIRSSLGVKYGIRLSNSTGIVDSDYVLSYNEGHILISLHNDSPKLFVVEQGDRVMQGIFQKYLKADNDDTVEQRFGGIGSTGV